MTLDLGAAVVDGHLRYTSVSQLEKADTDSEGGCLRRWFIRYVLREKEDQTEQMSAGDAIHQEFDRYFKTGEDVLGRVASAARIFMPRRGADLRSEVQILEDIEAPTLTCAGVPMTGTIDLVHTRGEYITPMGTLERDPDGTIELIDWKSKGTLRDKKTNVPYTKTGPALMTTIQMPAYAEWSFREMPTLEHSRLSHVYVQRSGPADSLKATTLADRERIARRWEQIEGIGRRIVHAASETDPNKIEPNPRACKAWNRQCGYSGRQCHLDEQQTLASIFGPRGADHMLQNFPPFAPGAAPNPQVSYSATDVMSALGAPPAVAPQVPAPTVTLTPEFCDAVATIRAGKQQDGSGVGMPPLKGAAALAFSALLKSEGTGHAVSDVPFKGEGRLGGIDAIDTVAGVVSLAGQMTQNGYCQPVTYVRQTAAPAPVTPPPINPLAGVMGILPADAPASQPHLASDPPKAAAPAVAAEEPEAEKKRRGRPPGAAKKEAPAATATPPGPEAPSTAVAAGGIVLGIDARPSVPHTDLDPYVHAIHMSILDHCHIGDKDFRDVRCSKDERLNFGKWPGVIASLVRERPPAPGIYYISTANAINAEVANALIPLSSLVFRGAR